MPDHWQVVKLGSLCERVKKKNSDGVDRVLTVAAGYGLVDQESYFNRRVAAKNLSGYSVIEKGTFVYNKSYSAAAPLGVIAASHDDLPGVVSPLYIVFRPVDPRVSPEFLELAVLSDTTLKILGTFVKEGGRAHGGINISIGDFFSVPVPLPPQAEQRRIVDLVGSIDTYIDNLETQAETTRTARSALLSELLSNPGDDWQKTTLGKIADYLNGFPFKPEHLTGVSLPVIRIRQLVDSSEVPDRTDLEVAEKHHIDDGDIVFSWSATLAVRIWNRGPALLNQHLFKVMPKEGVDGQWLSMALEHAIDDLANKSHGTTMKHITKKSLESHPTLVPPITEQRRIVDLVNSFDEQISSLESQVESVRALRSGVLSELLSGERLLDESYDVAVGL